MTIKAFFDPMTSTLTYVVFDPETRDAVIIDPVLDFDPLSWSVSETSALAVVAWVQEQGLTVHLALDTHAHADHLSGLQVIARETGAETVIGVGIGQVQAVFAELFAMAFPTDGSQFDRLAEHGVPLSAGSLTITPVHTPGHTPADVCYRIGDAVFTGDTIFMPDFGTGRCDFPGGSARALFQSVTTQLYALPDATRVFVGHDYQPGGRELLFETTVGACKADNIQLGADTDEETFVAWRAARDATLRPPRLIMPALQVNALAGRLPKADEAGRRFFRLPINALG